MGGGDVKQGGQGESAPTPAEQALVKTAPALPELSGSEKQVAWAAEVRSSLDADVEWVKSDKSGFPDEYSPYVDAAAEQMRSSETSASWWIDNRSRMRNELIIRSSELAEEALRNGTFKPWRVLDGRPSKKGGYIFTFQMGKHMNEGMQDTVTAEFGKTMGVKFPDWSSADKERLKRFAKANGFVLSERAKEIMG